MAIADSGITFSERVEYLITGGTQQPSVSYIPIIVVIIILLGALTMLILGVIGASYWKKKHALSTNINQYVFTVLAIIM